MIWAGSFIVGALAFLLTAVLIYALPIGALALIGVICMVYAFYDVTLYAVRLVIVCLLLNRNSKRTS